MGSSTARALPLSYRAFALAGFEPASLVCNDNRRTPARPGQRTLGSADMCLPRGMPLSRQRTLCTFAPLCVWQITLELRPAPNSIPTWTSGLGFALKRRTQSDPARRPATYAAARCRTSTGNFRNPKVRCMLCLDDHHRADPCGAWPAEMDSGCLGTPGRHFGCHSEHDRERGCAASPDYFGSHQASSGGSGRADAREGRDRRWRSICTQALVEAGHEVAGLPAKLMIIGQPPEKGRRVEQQSHALPSVVVRISDGSASKSGVMCIRPRNAPD